MNGPNVEVKFSTLWEAGEYVFQQLGDQDYELVLLLGVSPTIAHGWMVPKWVAFDQTTPQHGGARGADTKWIRPRAASPPPWLDEYGGGLAPFEMAVAC